MSTYKLTKCKTSVNTENELHIDIVVIAKFDVNILRWIRSRESYELLLSEWHERQMYSLLVIYLLLDLL